MLASGYLQWPVGLFQLSFPPWLKPLITPLVCWLHKVLSKQLAYCHFSFFACLIVTDRQFRLLHLFALYVVYTYIVLTSNRENDSFWECFKTTVIVIPFNVIVIDYIVWQEPWASVALWRKAETTGTFIEHVCPAVGCPDRNSRRPGLGWCRRSIGERSWAFRLSYTIVQGCWILPRSPGSHCENFCCKPNWRVGSWSHQYTDWGVGTSG